MGVYCMSYCVQYGNTKGSVFQQLKENETRTTRIREILRSKYSQLSLRRTPLGPALSVRLIESQIKGISKGRDQL